MHWVIIIFSFSVFMAATVGWVVWGAIRQRGPRVAIVTFFAYVGLIGGYFLTGVWFFIGDNPSKWDNPLLSLAKFTCGWGVIGTIVGLVAVRVLMKNERSGNES